jgi:hypothetical protein
MCFKILVIRLEYVEQKSSILVIENLQFKSKFDSGKSTLLSL